jgi:hypothetical protein
MSEIIDVPFLWEGGKCQKVRPCPLASALLILLEIKLGTSAVTIHYRLG